MKEQKLRVVIVEPQKEARVEVIENTLESLQRIVGGYIEAFYPFDEEVAVICNEEGRLLKLPPNRVIYNAFTGTVYDIIVGTFFIVGARADEDNFTSLTDEECKKFMEFYKKPEHFIENDKGIIVLK